MSQQNREFQDRMNRLREKAAESANRNPPPSRWRETMGNLVYPASLAGAFLLGALAVFLGRYIRFHLAAGATGDQTTDLDLMITGGLAMATSFVLAQMFRLSSKEHLALQSAGILATICTFHNLFHWAPAPMATVFSPAYVAEMRNMMPANTAIFRGMVFNLVEQAPAAAPEPDQWAMEDRETRDGAVSEAGTARDNGPRRLLLDSEK